ncbi:MAG TPA: metallophosphoesterase [Thermodesulfobacteriota bacterium]|nr:metallophosphoesterase [Thermodesulfobacteriota bacterium]HNU71325.1 metallophosphoesterase [Thermodesulfobacteriota bacterium]
MELVKSIADHRTPILAYMRIIFATDLHGNKRSFDSLFHHAESLQVDAVLLGGDILPISRNLDAYSSAQSDFIVTFLRPMIEDFKSRNQSDVCIILGNNDSSVTAPLLLDLEHEGCATYIHQRPIHRGDYTIYGYSFIPLTHFRIKDWEKLDIPGQIPPTSRPPYMTTDRGIHFVNVERDVLPRGTIEEDFSRVPSLIDPRKTILVTHTPPYQTKLDVLYNGNHCGSKAIAAFIEKYQPVLTLHGHIHESPSQSGSIVDRLGATVSINPGASTTMLHAVYLNVENPLGTLRRITD